MAKAKHPKTGKRARAKAAQRAPAKARKPRAQARPKPKPARRAPVKPSGPAATAALTSTMDPVRVPPGRPTKYDAAFCEQLLHHMAGGLSFESFAGVIGVSKKTLYNWLDTKENVDFLHAKERGTELCRLWWERLGIQGVQGLGPRVLSEETEEDTADKNGAAVTKIKRKYAAAQFVPGTWFRNMTNRFPEEWRDRHEVTGKDGKDLLPPLVPWESLAGDAHVQAFLAGRAAGQSAAASAKPSAPAAPRVNPL